MLYVYGFTRASDAPASADGGVGGGTVETVSEGDLAALVTQVGEEDVAPRRADLRAHAEVLRRAHEQATVLPLRFGIVMLDEETVRAELASRAGQLHELLDAVDGRLEMNLSAMYHEEVVLREVLNEHPEVVDARRRIEGMPADATHFERIRMGELVAHAVDAKRAADGDAILSELGSRAVAVSTGDPLHERMVVNAAFLVDRDRLAEFDQAVEETSRERADRMQFKLTGPLPPHSFVGAS